MNQTLQQDTTQVIQNALKIDNDDQELEEAAVEPVTESPYRTISRNTREIDISEFQPCEDIPDYKKTTSAEWPIAVQTPEGFFLLDGAEIIEQARLAGEQTIICEIDEKENHSIQDIAISKTAVREKTRGGEAAYMETARNIELLIPMFMSSMESPVIYAHGGNREGNEFTDNREDDVILLIAQRLGKDKKVINLYRNHIEFLAPGAIQFFIDEEVGKDFFVKAQSKKRNLINELKEKRASKRDKVRKVSKLMLDLYKEYVQKKEAKKKVSKTEPESPATVPAEANETVLDDTEEVVTDDSDSDSSDTEVEPDEPPSLERVKSGTLQVATRLTEVVGKPESSIEELAKCLHDELLRITRLLNQLKALQTKV